MQKATHEVLQNSNEQSFLLREFGAEAFDAPYHFHQEYELTLILSGTGKRYIGSHMENFNAGDLVLVGSNLPHCWKLLPAKQPDARAIVVQFTKDFLGDKFFQRPDVAVISALLQKSSGGIAFNAHEECSHLIGRMRSEGSCRALITFLEVLYGLATANDTVVLNTDPAIIGQNMVEQRRLNPALAYLVDNFRTDVSLTEAAALTNMTTNAFCKYFKKITRKTFMEMVIQYRLNYATQQLIVTDKPVSEISFDSGFGDVSHFYKTFKTKMGLSPLNYRKRFMVEV